MIVFRLYPWGDIVDRFILRGVHHSKDPLILERGVEGLCPRIVPARFRTPHRGPELHSF